MKDADMVNTINNESYHQEQEERVLKNKILAMSNVEKKQAEWQKYFAQPTYSEEINSMVF